MRGSKCDTRPSHAVLEAPPVSATPSGTRAKLRGHVERVRRGVALILTRARPGDRYPPHKVTQWVT